MMVVFRKIPDAEKLTERMFRSWVQLKWQDNLETIDAAAAYSQPFPYLFSVTGLALDTLNTIVMERDKYKRFRSTQYPHGIAPAKIEQPRGLTEIDYLSYITVPVASDMGQPEQTKLGVLDVDTKLFAAAPADLKIISEENGVCTARMSPDELNQLANNLYDQKDAGVEYLEDMRAVLVPVLKLYLRCRQGST